MEEEEEDPSGALASDAAIETLRSRGWCFGDDLDQVKAMVLIHSVLSDDALAVVSSVESELANMDLKSVGAKSLPDPVTLRKSSHLLGPKILQISWARDITKGNVEDFARSSSRRLLKFGLTDGYSEVAAIEYTHIPSIPDDVVPGTKVRLENKAVIRNGLVCLTPKVLTVIGGVVQSLYEEWQMNKKYAGFSRSSLRLAQESDGGGPPPFEKLQIGAPKSKFPRQDTYKSDGNTKSSEPTSTNTELRPIGKQQNLQSKSNDIDNSDKKNNMISNPKTDSRDEKTEDKPSSSSTRPKEVVEAVPVQNQAAAQKLLQKMSHQNQDSRYSRGRKFRGKGREEESEVFTLEEWEKRKAGAKPSLTAAPAAADVRRDEELAWQLQNQFDLEDSHVPPGPQNVEAENLKLSMFSYEKNDDWGSGMGNERKGRGRRRGRGRGRGRVWEDDYSGNGMEHDRSGRGRGWGRGREDHDGRYGRGREDHDVDYGMGYGRSERGWGRGREDDDRGNGVEHDRSGRGRGWGRGREDHDGGYGMEYGRGREDHDGRYGMEYGRGRENHDVGYGRSERGWGRGGEDDARCNGMEHDRNGRGRGDDDGGYGMEHRRSGRGRGRGRWSRGR